MKKWQFDSIFVMLLFIIWFLSKNLFFAICTLFFAILYYYDIFKPKHYLIETSYLDDNLETLKVHGKAILITPKIKEEFKILRKKELEYELEQKKWEKLIGL